MLLAAQADRIGKGADATSQRQGDALHLYDAVAVRAGKQEVEAAADHLDTHLAPYLVKSSQRGDAPPRQPRRDPRVGPGAMYAGKPTRRAFHRRPGARQLAAGPWVEVNPYTAAGLGTVLHRSGIGAMHGQLATIIELNICKKPLVAPNESARHQGPVERDQHPDESRRMLSMGCSVCVTRGRSLA